MINSKLDSKKLSSVCKVLLEEFPNPKTELNYTNHFTLLIAIILSAQATDKMVNVVTQDLFKVVQEPSDIIQLGKDKLKLYINKLNYFNTKAENIFKTANILINEHNSIVPDKFDKLIDLAGVGRKTANVFLNVAYNLPTIAVDTHVFRTINRIFGAEFTSPEEVENFLLNINTHKLKVLTHHLLILHGRYVCKARKPNCSDCKIKEYCGYYSKETN